MPTTSQLTPQTFCFAPRRISRETKEPKRREKPIFSLGRKIKVAYSSIVDDAGRLKTELISCVVSIYQSHQGVNMNCYRVKVADVRNGVVVESEIELKGEGEAERRLEQRTDGRRAAVPSALPSAVVASLSLPHARPIINNLPLVASLITGFVGVQTGLDSQSDVEFFGKVCDELVFMRKKKVDLRRAKRKADDEEEDERIEVEREDMSKTEAVIFDAEGFYVRNKMVSTAIMSARRGKCILEVIKEQGKDRDMFTALGNSLRSPPLTLLPSQVL